MTSRSVVYRERDTEREWDEQPRKSYTTVKRYQVPESSTLSPVEQDTTKEKITIRRERSAQPSSREEDYRYSDTRIRESDRDRGGDDTWNVKITERTRDADTRSQHDDHRYSDSRYTERDTGRGQNVTYTRYSDRDDFDDRRSAARSDHRGSYQTDYRYTERDREVARAPDPPTQNRVSEFRFERERDFSPPERRRDYHDDYEVERYVKETDYYQTSPQPIIIRERAAPAPQPIIIREERRDPAPIIIRERREPQYEFIERREVEEEKQLVRREETPPPAPQAPPSEAPRSQAPQQQQDEDYFYERRVIERERPRSRDHRSEIRPRDSASNYSSDDSYEYVRRERSYTEDTKDPHHKRHLAEGVVAGIAGAEILRHHRKSEGKDAGGRLKSAVGGALVGGVGAEVLSRARSRRRSRAGGSRSRSRSSSGDDRRDRRRHRNRSRDRSRSRSKSISRKQLAGLAGVAAAGALAGYVINKRKNNETVIVNERSPPRRSRSRRRRGSDDSYQSGGDDDKHRDPDHRNKRIAQAGLASAAAAGIWERVRSKSRGGKDRERSKSRVRQAVPVVGAGLGGAALAGLWEKNKANKEARRDKELEEQTGRGRRRRSRSRSRSVPESHREDRRKVNGRHLIAYGGDPVSPSQRSYYSDEEPGVYNRRRGGGSVGSSPDERRRGSRSRSRGKGLAEAGAAAGIGAVAAHEYGKRKDRKRADREREHQGRDDDYYDDRYGHDDRYGPSPGPYSPEPPSGYLPPQQNAGYPTQQTNYPGGAYFPPPPTGENVYAHNEPYPNQQQQQAAYPPYNPADYGQPGVQPAPYNNTRNAYSEQNLGAPYANDTFAGDTRYAAEEHPDEGRGRGPNPPPEHVSAPVENASTTNPPQNSERDAPDADGVSTPRARSSSRVRFNLDANQYNSPEQSKKRVEERFSDSETHDDRKRRHRKRKHRRDEDGARDSPQLMHDQYERAPKDRDNESDSTEDLPERFDQNGNPKHQQGDPLELLLGGLASRFLGGGAEEEERHGRRRHRH